jgi:uncharacterized membrane protein
LLSIFLLYVDKHYYREISNNYNFLFSGSAAAARGILATIAGSVITVVSIAFSLTIISMQQASSQYSPRVLRSFTSNRGNQIVLGVYISTFTYSILILRSVRETNDVRADFVPAISTSFAMLLAIICIGLLIYFINHTSNSLLATTVIKRIHRNLLNQFEKQYPMNDSREHIKKQDTKSMSKMLVDTNIKSESGGFVLTVDLSVFKHSVLDDVEVIEVLPRVGEFILSGQEIIQVSSTKKLSEDLQNDIRGSIVLETERSSINDPLQAIRQLVDVALKGLSPGVNDVTTAIYCIRFLGDALSDLSNRTIPSDVVEIDNVDIDLIIPQPQFKHFVNKAFLEIILVARENVRVFNEVIKVLKHIATETKDIERKKDLAIFVKVLNEIFAESNYIETFHNQISGDLKSLNSLVS